MRQINRTGYTQHISVWPTDEHPDQFPRAVADGEETDFPTLLAGFVPVVEDSMPKTRRKDAAAAADKEEGEPQ